MTNFPADVVKAEQLTDGNINILNSLETPTKSKASSSILNVESVKKSTPASSSPTPATKKPAGSYNSSVKVQNTTNVVHKSSDKRLTCTMCNFATDRMNLLMMHIKNHSLSIIQRVNGKTILAFVYTRNAKIIFACFINSSCIFDRIKKASNFKKFIKES